MCPRSFFEICAPFFIVHFSKKNTGSFLRCMLYVNFSQNNQQDILLMTKMKPFILITILSRLFYEKIQCDAYDTYENRFVDSDDCKLKFGNSCFVYDKINKIATSTTCNEALRKLTTDDCRKIPVRFGWEVCNVGKSQVLLNERKSRYKLNGKTKHKVRRILDPNICDVHYEYGDIKTCDEKPKMLTTSVRGYDKECKADVSYLVAVKGKSKSENYS